MNYDRQKDVMKRFKAKDRSTLIMFKGSKEAGRLYAVTDAKEIQALLDKGF